eukprot:COSAG05_NODE_1578_length_4501_cov_2.007269_3_plen_236_part_00
MSGEDARWRAGSCVGLSLIFYKVTVRKNRKKMAIDFRCECLQAEIPRPAYSCCSWQGQPAGSSRSAAMMLLLLLLPCAASRVAPCEGDHKASPWCDATKLRQARIEALVNALTPEEKSSLLSNTAQPVPRLGLPAYDWWNEAVHGFARVQFINGSDTHVNATSFPMSIGVSSSFNRTLWNAVGGVIGREARGAANSDIYGVDALTFWAPNINVARDSRWGRNQETPGEDPTTNGE